MSAADGGWGAHPRLLTAARPNSLKLSSRGGSPSASRRSSSKPAADQIAIVEKVAQGTKPLEAARQVRSERIAARRPEEFAGKYRVIYADPPWEYGNSQHGVTTQRDHYPCMSLDDICAIDVQSVAEDDAVLFLWATSPILREALRVVEAWGFAYKASFVWDKCQPMIGHYNMVAHELLLICTRGACRPDTNDALVNSVQQFEKTEHSRKPERFREIIDALYPHGNRIAQGTNQPRGEVPQSPPRI